jgi:hypothetical protein
LSRFGKLLFDIYVNGSAGPFQGNIFDGSLMHREKERMCVCLLSPFLNTGSFFPTLPPQLPIPTILIVQAFIIFFSLVHPSSSIFCMLCAVIFASSIATSSIVLMEFCVSRLFDLCNSIKILVIVIF